MLLQVMTDSAIVVSTLPHPVSMFFLAIGFAINIYLFLQQRSLKDEINESIRKENRLGEKFNDLERLMEKRIDEVSRKVDSRVDKALKKN